MFSPPARQDFSPPSWSNWIAGLAVVAGAPACGAAAANAVPAIVHKPRRMMDRVDRDIDTSIVGRSVLKHSPDAVAIQGRLRAWDRDDALADNSESLNINAVLTGRTALPLRRHR